MENPWRNLPQTAPYFLKEDKQTILQYNSGASEDFKIVEWYLPEPFLGDPSASVVLLNGNPGANEIDRAYHGNPRFQKLNQDNLLHNGGEYPFYLLNPAVNDMVPEASEGSPGNSWWNQKLGPLINDCGVQTVSQKVFVVEYFPYHSAHLNGNLKVPSQAYSFDLVKKAMQRNALIIIMRSKTIWFEAIPELNPANPGKSYAHSFILNSPQNPTISRNNCPVGRYDELVKICKSGV